MRRILAIDGGGIKGVFPASFLSTVEDTLNDQVKRAVRESEVRGPIVRPGRTQCW